jgi:beta-glucosidase
MNETEDADNESQTRFMWGVTSASAQIEGVHPAADWSRWEANKTAPTSSDGNGFATNFHDDLALIASLGVTDVRLGIEWARIEPVEGKVDSQVLDRYADVVNHARQVGLRPWLTLHHTTLPGWFSEDTKGFIDSRGREYHWLRHVDRCAERFADAAAGWVPIDDPVGWALRGYGLGSRPPGKRSSTDLGLLALYEAIEGALLADHVAARHLRAGGSTVMAVRGTPTIFTATDDDRSDLELQASRRHVRWWAATLFDSWIRMMGDGELVLPDRRAQHDEQWANDHDLIGLAFDHPISIDHTGQLRPYPADGHRSDTGFCPLPEELGVLLHRIADRVDRPIVVAGNGVSTTNDEWRTELLEQTLGIVTGAADDGVPIAGYFHDTAIDGYEWRAGFATERGLINRDRTVKSSGEFYRDWIAGR